MKFEESTDYLLSLGNEVSAMKLGLDNVRRLLAELEDPQTQYLKVQVAGTNGKGSVSAFLNSICIAAGIRVGMYTSPHLVSMTERVKIDGKDLDDDAFATIATRVRDTSEKLVGGGELENVPTYFEQVTAIALIAFAEAKVELAILETGLGGRLDATTATNAEIAAITRIDIDHQKYLGDTIEEIAAEKAAIIHRGSRVVIGEQVQAAMKVILDRCADVGVEPKFASRDLAVGGGNPTGREGVARECNVAPSLRVGFPPLGLAGRHQAENASIAVGVADLLGKHFPISDAAVHQGLERARHPGRLEFYDRYLFDGAHNIGGARALRGFLDESVDQPITMIFGSMDDKNVKEIGEILFPKADKLILTRPENSRALSAEEILNAIAETFRNRALVTENVDDAIRIAAQVSEENSLILVTGSLYLVGEARRSVSRASSG